MKFRKLPVVIEAVKWTGANVDEVATFFGTPSAIVAACLSEVLNERRLPIVTLEGVVMASPGDWIIRGIKGEYYPCKPDVFERTYEAAEEKTPASAWNSPGVAVSTARVVVRNAGHASGRNIETALTFLLTRIGSWTNSRWDQHLRAEFGDEFAGPVIIALKRLSRLSELG